MPARDASRPRSRSSRLATERGRSPLARTLLALSLGCALLALLAVSAFAASKELPSETLVVFHKQLDTGQVHAVVFHRKVNTMHVSLDNGSKVVVTYPASEQQRLAEEIGARHVTVSVVQHKTPKHKLRYIVGGVLIVVIVVVVGILLYMRSRKRREEEGPRAPVPGAGAP
jgi:ATP-dependent Zn protease